MSKAKRKTLRIPDPRARSRGRGKLFIAVGIVLLVAIAAAVMFMRGASASFDLLNGRWVRADGGYVLEIRSIDAAGKIEAAYFNPKPINIAKADATRDGSAIKLFVELRAPNYPGSTYTLTYDREQDQLKGIYFQAVEQQRYDVYFVRMK